MLGVLLVVVVALVVRSGNQVKASGAVIINDDSCVFVLEDGVTTAITNSDHRVETPSGNGLTVCKAQTTNSTGKAIVLGPDNTPYDVCFTTAGLTTNWKQVISASGQVTLSCRFNGQGQ
jgi:hypothetical protein